MMYYFAILNKNSICDGACETEVDMSERDNYIPLSDTDDIDDFIGKMWNGAEWKEYQSEETSDPVMKKLDSIEAKIQTNEDLQTFYDDIVKEVGL